MKKSKDTIYYTYEVYNNEKLHIPLHCVYYKIGKEKFLEVFRDSFTAQQFIRQQKENFLKSGLFFLYSYELKIPFTRIKEYSKNEHLQILKSGKIKK